MTSIRNSQHGRQRLIEAALNLSYQKRSFSSLGIREIAREAGLSAPAFYRHFADLSDLGNSVIQQVGQAVTEAFAEVRNQTASEADLDIRPMLIRRFFQWAADHPKEVVIGASEAFGALPNMRKGVDETISAVAIGICTDPRISNLLPGLPEERMQEILTFVARNIFFMAVDYVEKVNEREEVFAKALRMVDVMFAGAHTLHALALEQAALSNPQLAASNAPEAG